MMTESLLPTVYFLLAMVIFIAAFFVIKMMNKHRKAKNQLSIRITKNNPSSIIPPKNLSLLARSCVVAVYNIKGGVGKTTSAVNIAYHLSQQGYRTLLWDMDPQGSTSFFFDMELGIKGGLSAVVEDMHHTKKERDLLDDVAQTPYKNLFLLPSDSSFRFLDMKVASAPLANQFIKQLLSPFRDEYDYIIVDCPPSLTVSVESMLNVSNLIVVPTIPTTLSVRMLDELVNFVKDEIPSKPRILAFCSMMNGQKALHQQIYEQLCIERKSIMSLVVVPYLAEIERMGVEKAPLAEFASLSVAVSAYANLARDIINTTDVEIT